MQLAIFGPGLIGGSIALAAQRAGACERLTVWSRDAQECKEAATLGLQCTGDLAEAGAGCDLAIFCTPPSVMIGLAAEAARHLPSRAAISEVASVKSTVSAALEAQFGARYVGAHPMAGRETSGLGAADANLFENTVCLLTPHAGSAPEIVELMRDFWQRLGARIIQLSVAQHDEAVALISHLPHVAAAAMVNFVAEQPGEALACAGPGWRDATRLAGGAPDLWIDILSGNRVPITRALHGTIAKLREAADYLEAGREDDLKSFLLEARRNRARASAEEK